MDRHYSRKISLRNYKGLYEKGKRRLAVDQQCLYCRRSNHQTKECRTVRTAIDRRNALRGQPACWKCFALDHRSRDCTLRNCPECKGDHDITICTKDDVRKPQERGNRPENSQLLFPTQKTKTKPTEVSTSRSQSNCTVVDKNQPSATHEHKENTIASFSNVTEDRITKNSSFL
ncbi:unnamed protein product [Heligmosomoides polygyrus]|uniref:Nucleic-acid-binding protein from transposon X-element n=1 Tax=Heligmosomoides polygyrus TaxID=6339 RepID=A0A183FI82_HELPZ|nr:unnamed protein product [Heligmosomoides polygyrus]